MTSSPADLATPVLLAAMPQIQDPFFNHSVVLLIDHQPEGSFGLIINRATELTVKEVLDGLEIDWAGDEEELTHFGGPVQPQLGTVLYQGEASTLPAPEETSLEICDGIHLTQHIGDLSTIAGAPPGGFRLLLGYAGWGTGQLEEEIERNDWLVAPLDLDLLFASDTDSVWHRVLESLDIDPQTLPSWTEVSEADKVN